MKLFHKAQALVLFALALAIIIYSSCTTPEKIIYVPMASPSPSESPKQASKIWPTTGWVSEYDALLLEGFQESLIKRICPKGTLTPKEVWKSYWRAIVKAESGFNRVSQYTEDLGIDPITKKQVKSEGLFQLSYQDERIYPECDFDWEQDKLKAEKDPSKTIFDPVRQIKCAMAVVKKLNDKYPNGHPKWGNPLGAYWSTARPGKNGEKYFRQAFPNCF